MYFPTNKEEDAFCDSCVRKNAETCSELHNPNNRYLRSEHGNKLSIKPDSIKLEGATKEPLSISLDENEGIQILSNKSITLTAKDSIEFNTPKKINIKAETKLVAQKTNSKKSLYIEGSHNFLGADIVPRATQRETYEPYKDDEPEVAPEKPFNLLELMANVVAAVVTVGAIGAFALAGVAVIGLGATVAIGLAVGALSLISMATKPKALTDAIFAPEYPIDGEATTGAMGYFKEEVEEPTMLSRIANLLAGPGDGINDTVIGIYDMFRHPIRTGQGLLQILEDPDAAVLAIGLSIGESFVDNVINGDGNTRARFFGRSVFEVGTILLPYKVGSISKIEKLAQIKKMEMAIKGIDIVKGISNTNAFVKVMSIIEKADLVNKLNKLKFADDVLKNINNIPISVRTKIDDVVKNAKDISKKIGDIEVPVLRKVPELAGFGDLGFYTEKVKLSKITNDIFKMSDEAAETGKKNVDNVIEDTSKTKLTEPSLERGGKPKGNYENEVDRGICRQNESADLFANEGYDIEMLSEVNGGNGHGIKPTSNPDFLIDGKPFDCYAPDVNTSINNICRTITKKTKKQAERIVLNLDDYPIEKVDELIENISRKANPNGDLKHLQELFIVKDGKITRKFVR
ncbi:CdiA C-terminal domain-containing protein [Tepidibacter mesophilus]|uniref:CdiA C-terminal domain-containing protein n=1 Tax=Tepidibacter mesophilus TaxID=655607 RepID=UPI001A9A43AA|nr:hypothetical protein [Tepidibacter mesophilus]